MLGRVGDSSLHERWIADTSVERNWDLQLSAFGKDLDRVQQGDFPVEHQLGTKFSSAVLFFKKYPELLDTYEYIVPMDEDVDMGASEINRLFEIAKAHDLIISQASMTLESYISHHILVQVPGLTLRYCNFIETMAPCIRSDYLKFLLPMLEHHHSGWGIDYVWASLMPHPEEKAAIIDAVSMTHTRPVRSGKFYDLLRDMQISPEGEVSGLLANFERPRDVMHVYGGFRTDGSRISAAEARLRSAAHLAASLPVLRKPLKAVRTAAGLVYRAATSSGYRPPVYVPRPGSNAATWFAANPSD